MPERRTISQATAKPQTKHCQKCCSRKEDGMRSPKSRTHPCKCCHRFEEVDAERDYLWLEACCEKVSKWTMKPLAESAYVKYQRTSLVHEEHRPLRESDKSP